MRIIESNALCAQYRRPRSKRKRMRAKWAKDPSNWKPITHVIMIQGVAYAHPAVARCLRAVARETEEAAMRYVCSGMKPSGFGLL